MKILFDIPKVQAWGIGLLVIVVIQSLRYDISNPSSIIKLTYELLIKSVLALVLCYVAVEVIRYKNKAMPYCFFFLISIATYFGFSKILTGSISESSNLYVYGISFYLTTIAYLEKKNMLKKSDIFVASNPLLLITGPIGINFRSIKYKSAGSRFSYYLPFCVLGVFLQQIISKPLTLTFDLILKTDAISILIFGLLFEIFVYTNFCGLSLIVYGICGIFGFKVPLNFKQPFSSRNLVEFWRGWHVSLTMVLKELFYNPSRNLFGQYIAIIIVFLSSALWHGVSLNFILWGILHSLCFILTLLFLKYEIKIAPFILMIAGLIAGRILFSDDNSLRLMEKSKFTLDNSFELNYFRTIPSATQLSILFGIVFVGMEMILKNQAQFAKRNYKFYRLKYIQLMLIMLTLLCIGKNTGLDYAVYGQR